MSFDGHAASPSRSLPGPFRNNICTETRSASCPNPLCIAARKAEYEGRGLVAAGIVLRWLLIKS
jgi:hypothetical protein